MGSSRVPWPAISRFSTIVRERTKSVAPGASRTPLSEAGVLKGLRLEPSPFSSRLTSR